MNDATEVQLRQYELAAETLKENLQRVMDADLRKEVRIQKLEELVRELSDVYYNQDGRKIRELRRELGI
jgi:uncharacterized membrane protein